MCLLFDHVKQIIFRWRAAAVSELPFHKVVEDNFQRDQGFLVQREQSLEGLHLPLLHFIG